MKTIARLQVFLHLICFIIGFLASAHAAPLEMLFAETRLYATGEVAISRDTAVVNGMVFVRGANGWAEQQLLAGRLYLRGGNVAVDGDTLVYGRNIYTRNGAIWTLQQRLPRVEEGEDYTTAVSGNTILIGKAYEGAVWVLERSGSAWLEQARITVAQPGVNPAFGVAVAVDGDRIVVGAPGNWGGFWGIPSVYVYVRNGTNWIQEARLTDSTGKAFPDSKFGQGVSISGNTIVAGDPNLNDGSGAVSVFVRSGTNWVEQQKILGTVMSQGFGSTVALSGDGLIAGGAVQGSMRLFGRGETAWIEQPLPTNYVLGPKAAISGDTLLVNAPAMNGAFVFERRSWTWQNQNIGDTGVPGSMSVDRGIGLSGGGADIGHTADAFHYGYRPWTGDGTFIARVTSIDFTDAFAKGGIMLRATLEADSPNVFMLFRAGGRAMFQSRSVAADETSYTDASWGSFPYWLKIVRVGNRFAAYECEDRTRWKLVAATNINMPDTIFAGLAVTSRRHGTPCTAMFDHIEMSPLVDITKAPDGLMAVEAGSDRIYLSWNDNSRNEQGFRIESSTDNVNFEPLVSLGADHTRYWARFDTATKLFFRIQATGNNGDSTYSEVAEVTKASTYALPGEWQSRDIGATRVQPGDAFVANRMFVVTGSGYDVHSFDDDFHYAYRPFSGNGEIIAKVDRVSGGYHPQWLWKSANAGVMFRQSLASNAQHAFLFEQTLRFRDTAGSGTTQSFTPTAPLSGWLRLTRTGRTFTAWHSLDGVAWTQGESHEVQMTDPILVGLAVTPYSYQNPSTAMFSNVRVLRDGARAPTLSPVTRLSDGTIQLSVQSERDRTYAVEASTNLVDWSLLRTELGTGGVFIYTDNATRSLPRRFYRVVVLD